MKISGNKHQYQFEGPVTVWRENKYSMLLSAGAMISRKFLWIENLDKSSTDSLKVLINVLKTNQVSKLT